jgi:predicted metal-binding membrane protein
VLLVVAGVYQFTPLKQACLRACRSPFAFVLNHWRDGWMGALRMGLAHGAYCIGCCAVLMALLFLAGAMNLLWVAALAAFVFAEKLLPGGVWVGRAGGVAMLGFGVVLVVKGLG